MTSNESLISDLLEILWMAEREYGEQLSAPDQVNVARALGARRLADLAPRDIEAVFGALDLQPPPRGYANLVLTRARSLHEPESLIDELLGFRQFAIQNLSGEHGGKTKGNEDRLRNDVLTYLRRGYAEARTGRGRTDIVIPKPEDVIIETKVWTTRGVYEDGVVELGRYIHTSAPKQAAFVLFGDRDPLPAIIDDPRQAIAETRHLEGLDVPVVIVPFEVDQPSKARSNERKRIRDTG